MSEEVASRQETIEAFIKRSKRKGSVGIRQSFLQPGRGGKGGPGVLAGFVRRRDHLGLDIYLLLLLRGRGARYGGHYVEVQAGTWCRALGLESASAGQVLSRALGRLEARLLIRRKRTRRGVRVELLKEDGSGAKYSPPSGGQQDPYFQLPFAYWLEDYYLSLETPAKAMLLVALGETQEFELPVARVQRWYGISAETALRGLDDLVRKNLARFEQRYVKDPLQPAGRRLVKFWRLLGPFGRAAAETEPRIRRVK